MTRNRRRETGNDGKQRGKSVPTWENLIKLIEIHQVNINWLLTGEGTIFLSSKGYTEIEESSKPVIRDTESDISEIVAELRKDEDLKKLIHNYIKGIGGAKRAAAALKRKANGLTSDTTQRERGDMEEEDF